MVIMGRERVNFSSNGQEDTDLIRGSVVMRVVVVMDLTSAWGLGGDKYWRAGRDERSSMRTWVKGYCMKYTNPLE